MNPFVTTLALTAAVDGIDPVATRLAAAPAAPEWTAEIPCVDADAPRWLVDAAHARWTDDTADRLEAVGLLARHAPRPVVRRLRAWARTLGVDDIAWLESRVHAEITMLLDRLDDVVSTRDPAFMKALIFERDRVESLAMVRTLVGVGSPVHARLRDLDERIEEHLLTLPKVEIEDRAIAAAGNFNPDAWWSNYASAC